MPRNFARLVFGLIAAATLPIVSLVAPTASAVVLNISDNSCEKWVLGDPAGDPPTQQLTCTSMAAATCTINGPSQGLIGANITLTADCSPGPISSYAWTGGNCAGLTGSSCNATSGASGSVAYGVTATNAKGPGAPASKTVNWSNTPTAVAPSNCNLTVTPSATPFSVGTQVDLSASCSGGDPVTKWTWTDGGSSFALDNLTTNSPVNTNRAFVSVSSGTLTFKVQGENAGGLGPLVTKTLTGSGGSTGGSTGGGSTGGSGTTGAPIAACTGFSATKVMDITIGPDGSGSGTRKYVTDVGAFRNTSSAGFGANEALIVVFKAPPTDALFTLGVTHTGGALGGSTTRTYVLSAKPCDFAIPKSADAIFADETSLLSLRLSSGTPGSGRYNLNPGQEYYLNIKNTAFGGTVGCTASRCDVFVSPGNP